MTGTYQVYRFLWGSLDWLFPPVCAGCGKAGYRWCPACQESIKLIEEPLCHVCGNPFQQGGLYIACSDNMPAFDAMRSWAVFEGPIRQALQSLKYRRNIALGDTLARSLARHLETFHWAVDVVTAVPAGKKRLSERGYNQVALFARPLASLMKKSYDPKILMRMRETRTQVGLSRDERKENVAGAFQGHAGRSSGKSILVVYDVTTSGATLGACAEALREAGAWRVYALTLARALPRHGL